MTVLVGLIAFLVLPQPAGLNVRSKLAAAFGSGTAPDGTPEGAPAPRDAAAYQGGSLDLRSRGMLPADPMLVVPKGSPSLWRGDVLVNYDGSSWTADAESLTPEPDQPELDVPPGRDDVTGTALTTRTDTAVRLPAFTGVIVAPGRITALRVDGPTLQTGHSVRVLSPTSRATTGPYTVTSVVPSATDAELRKATGPDDVSLVNLELPGALPLRVTDLARQITAGATNRYDKVKAIERYLAASERYQLDSPVPAPGADAVDDFLFVSHRGFCEQYASAETVMLRAIGIPARLATGLAYGSPDGNGHTVFRASDSHAWVEVYFPGVGWISSDPTAGATLADDVTSTSLIDTVTQALSSWGGRALLAVTLVLLGLLAGVGGRWLVRRSRRARRGEPGEARTGVVLAAFGRLEQALASTGRPRPPAASLREVEGRLPRSPKTRQALVTLERLVYADRPPTPAEEQQAAETFDELARQLMAPVPKA